MSFLFITVEEEEYQPQPFRSLAHSHRHTKDVVLTESHGEQQQCAEEEEEEKQKNNNIELKTSSNKLVVHHRRQPVSQEVVKKPGGSPVQKQHQIISEISVKVKTNLFKSYKLKKEEKEAKHGAPRGLLRTFLAALSR